MTMRAQLDLFGFVSLVGFSALLGLNQVVIKVVNDGLQPVFMAGLRSFGAAILLYLWMRATRQSPRFERRVALSAILAGLFFASEFILLFLALDYTSVARSSLMFYTMPIWFAVLAHFLIEGERLTSIKALGLACAVAGVALALLGRGDGLSFGSGDGLADGLDDGLGDGSIFGDLLALVGSFGWAGIAVLARISAFATIPPTLQIFWQLTISSVVLLGASLAFGPFIRDFAPIHSWLVAFQIVVMGAGGFLFWFWLLKRYPTGTVTSFSFLAPIFGVALGWLILGEPVGQSLLVALGLVCLGLVLINRPKLR